MNAINNFAAQLTGKLGNVTTGQAATGGLALGLAFGTLFTWIMVIAAVIWVLYIVSWWVMFKKAGDKGWKAIIPFYNVYTMYKLTWDKSMFWVILALDIIAGILLCIGQLWSVWVALVVAIAYAVISIIAKHKISKSFGHGVGFTLGLIFLDEIFYPIIAFGSSEYVGPAKD